MKKTIYLFAILLTGITVSCSETPGDTTEPNPPLAKIVMADDAFMQICLSRYDIDGDGILTYSDVQNETMLAISNENIKNLYGIGYFTNLSHLSCAGNLLGSLDVFGNTSLTSLACSSCGLDELIYNGNMKQVNCSDNNLIDISVPKGIVTIACRNNNIEYLEVSNRMELEELDVRGNNLKTLDVSKNPKLKRLNCLDNPELSTVYVKKGHEFLDFTYDSSVTQIVYVE